MERVLSIYPAGWQATFFSNIDEEAHDHYKSFAEWNPASNSLGEAGLRLIRLVLMLERQDLQDLREVLDKMERQDQEERLVLLGEMD